jgi:hypothetical protein
VKTHQIDVAKLGLVLMVLALARGSFSAESPDADLTAQAIVFVTKVYLEPFSAPAAEASFASDWFQTTGQLTGLQVLVRPTQPCEPGVSSSILSVYLRFRGGRLVFVRAEGTLNPSEKATPPNIRQRRQEVALTYLTQMMGARGLVREQPDPERRVLRVVLNDPAGNPDPVGRTVVFDLNTGFLKLAGAP